ncbi:hypothetical protein KY289_021073 [Solanum tuberosum]|nr:hypothetical protein KY289_021073 [Solanum tuberosum]
MVIEKTVRELMLSEEGKDVKKRVADMQQSIVSGMQIDGISYKNMKDLVDFISALPSWLPPPTPAVGEILSSNHIPSNYIGDFEYVDDHRSEKIVVELNGRLNMCGVISPRFDVGVKEIEGWTARLLPSRQV